MIVIEGRHYLYRHVRLDTNEVFYVGVGTKPTRYRLYTTEYSRAYKKKGRSSFWRNIVDKSDYEVEILMESDDYDFLKLKEIDFIRMYGRRDLGLGTLVNLTDGGDGNLNGIVSKETRIKRSNALKGKTHSEESRQNMIKGQEYIINSTREQEVGKLYKMKQGFFVKILEYNGNKKVLIEILGTGEKRTRALREIKAGFVKDYSLLTSQGKGYLGKRGNDIKETRLWRSFQHQYGNIYGISDNWLSFENFINWHNQNKKDGLQLATHLFEEHGKCDDSNTYFIPHKLHMILLPAKGYSILRNGKITTSFRGRNNGIFASVEQAIEKHKILKKDYIDSLVEEYKDIISIELYNKVKNYNVKVLSHA